MTERVLMVCIGNICRSPLAEALWNHRIGVGKDFSKRAGSAGLYARFGDVIHPHSQELLNRHGVPLPEEGSTPWSAVDLRSWDLILVMEASHREEIEQRSPTMRGRVFTLGHWSSFSIPDPMGKSLQAFEEVYQAIDQGVDEWIKKLGYRIKAA